MASNTNLSTPLAAPNAGHARSVSSFARPNNTTAYSANDVVFETGAGVIQFDKVGPSGAVLGVTLVAGDNEVVDFDLLLFESEPTNFADNVALALVNADLNKLAGFYSFATASKGVVDTNKSVYEAAAHNPLSYTSDKGKLYGILVARDAFTPTANAVFALSLHIEADK